MSFKEDTVWLTQNDIAKLFDTAQQNISYHINNIYNENELEEWATHKENLLVQNEGDRSITRSIKLYNLDMIISIGYRVNSKRGIEFRKWATTILKSYLLNGYSVNEKRCIECKDNIISLNNKVESLINKDLEKEKRISKLENLDTLFKDKLFYEGEIYEAYAFIKDLFLSAKEKIIIIDGYIDYSALKMLTKINIPITLYTFSGAPLSKDDINKFKTNHNLEVIKTNLIHDRFIIIDNDIYACGASIKDLGKKRFIIVKSNIDSYEEIIKNIKK